MARVLVIEDDRLDRTSMRAALERAGHSTVLARARDESTRRLEDEGADLVVLCAALPDASLRPFVEGLKRRSADGLLPVVLLASLGDVAARHVDLGCGADEILANLDDPAPLLPAIEGLLARRTERARVVQERDGAIERERMREELTALVVHDLKNPLSAILANLDFVLDDAPRLDASTLEAIVETKGAARRAFRLLANLLDVARIEANRLQLQARPVELRGLLGSVARARSPQAEARSVSFEVALDADLTVAADEDMLTRLIESVLDNALRYTPREGRIRFTSQREADGVRLRIANSGPALPPAVRESLFEKFEPGSEGKRLNPGLGLYFCRLAAEAHGGRIWIEEEPEFPTVFVLELRALL